MECTDVGNTNADIAGLGVRLFLQDYSYIPANHVCQIICAFVVQGSLSVVLSIVSVATETFQIVAQRDNQYERARNLRNWVTCMNTVLESISQTQIINGVQSFVYVLHSLVYDLGTYDSWLTYM